MTRRTSRALFAVAALVAAGSGAAVIATVATASSPGASALVPITPCRLFDTRPGDINVGSRPTPLTAGETFTVPTWGSNGNCSIPTGATALSLNVVAIGPTAGSFLTVFPADVTRPSASSLNWVAGQAPTPNAVTARLGADGHLSFYNLAGTVDLAVDVVGYYEAVGAGASGPAGPTGPAGPAGPQGPGVDPARVIWVAESGGDFTTISAALASITDNSLSTQYLIKVAPGTYVENAGIDLKPYVDIAGSGPNTVIQSNGSGAQGAAVRIGASIFSEVRDLTIAGSGAVGVYSDNGRLTLRDVEISIFRSVGLATGMIVQGGTLRLLEVDVMASSSSSSATAIEVTSSATVDADRLTAYGNSGSGFSSCRGVAATSATLRLVDAHLTAGGCGSNSALWASAATLDVRGAVLLSSGMLGAADYAVYLEGSVATLDGLEVDQFQGYGVLASNSEVLVRDSTIIVPTTIARVSGKLRAMDSLLDGTTSGMSGRCTSVIDASYTDYTCI